MSGWSGFSHIAMAFLLTAPMWACGGSESEEQGGARGSARGGELVSAEAVRNCAGFSTEDAAQVLDLPAAEIEEASEDIHETLRGCSYRSTRDPMTGVAFTLATSESVEEAVDGMAYGREMAGMAKRTIEGVTETGSSRPALEEVEGVGDEAYWMEVNGTLNVRVKNVEIQIQAPDDTAQQKEVARRIVNGLTG